MTLTARNQILSSSALVGAFLIALLFYLVFPPAKTQRTLFFPGAIGRALEGEARLVPVGDSRREEVSILVEELILGPVSIRSARALPRTTEVNLVAVRDSKVFVDLSEDLVLDDRGLNLTFDERIDAIRQSIRFNFRDIESVIITIAGQELYAPYYNLPESRN